MAHKLYGSYKLNKLYKSYRLYKLYRFILERLEGFIEKIGNSII